MKYKSIFALLPALLLWSGCQPSAPSPAQPATPPPAAGLSAEAAPPPSADDGLVAVCQAVLKKIYRANGDAAYPLPTVFLSENTTCMAAFFPRKNAIEVERRVYELCRTFGRDSLSALAFVLGHEFSHALDAAPSDRAFRSNFWAYNRQPGSSMEREKSADVRGAFLAHLAGYRIVPIIPALIERLYAAYPRQGQSAAYPSETERRQTAVEVQGLVDTLIQVFEAANYLLATGQSDMAAVCYEQVLQTYRGPEIWNNLGIACALEALRLPGDDDFAYPFELDWQLRLGQPRGAAPTEQQATQRRVWLQRSQAAFAEALRLAPGQFLARANAWCVAVVADKMPGFEQEVNIFSQNRHLSRPEVERLTLIRALAAARAGEAAEAGQLFAKLAASASPETATLARYNADVLKNGGDRAALPGANESPACPIDPATLDLPSVLTLRRMAGAFEGMTLGNGVALTLAWEKNAARWLLKARIGADRFCILHLAPAQRAPRLSAAAAPVGFNGPAGSRLFSCEQYIQMFRAGRLSACGVFYAYREP